MTAINRVDFQVNWNAANAHLHTDVRQVWNHSESSLFWKIGLCFSKIIDSIVHSAFSGAKQFVGRVVLPSSTESREDRAALDEQWQAFWSVDRGTLEQNDVRRTYQASQMNVTTPDGSVVTGAVYRNQRAAGQDVPTIICFNPNAMLAKTPCWDWLLQKGISNETPFNVVVFDYRPGDILNDANECILDGDSVYQAVRDGLGVSTQNIHMIGYSLGGGISALVRESHPEAGNYVNLRSFASVGNVVKYSPMIDQVIAGQPLPECLKSSCMLFVIKGIVAGLVSLLKWNIDVSSALKTIGDRALVVIHPGDPLIPPDSSPIDYVDPSRAVRLRYKDRYTNESEDQNHHVTPLSLYQDENGLNASKRIVNSLLAVRA